MLRLTLLQDVGDPRQYLLNLALVFVLARILTWHYLRFSPVPSSKEWFARAFPILAATSMFVSMIVQISPIVSLGMLGALTLMRFRAPIKEPEELAYLFLSIAIGLGMGADEWLITFFVVLGVLVYMTVISLRPFAPAPARVLVRVSGQLDGGSAEHALTLLLGEGAAAVDLTRVETRGSDFSATFVVEERSDRVAALTARSRSVFPEGTIDIVPDEEPA